MACFGEEQMAVVVKSCNKRQWANWRRRGLKGADGALLKESASKGWFVGAASGGSVLGGDQRRLVGFED